VLLTGTKAPLSTSVYCPCPVGFIQLQMLPVTTGNRAFVVRLQRTTKKRKCMENPLLCVFLGNTQQRPHNTNFPGKEHLLCALYRDTPHFVFVVRF
jgi:hypothetical protein